MIAKKFVSGGKQATKNTDSDMPKKLSYAAISDITGMDKETVRR